MKKSIIINTKQPYRDEHNEQNGYFSKYFHIVAYICHHLSDNSCNF